MQQVKVLALIFVEPFDLYVVDGIRVRTETESILNGISETQLVLMFNTEEFILEYGIIGVDFKLAKLIEVPGPFIPYF